MSNQAGTRASSEDALKDKTFETPEPIGDYTFLQERVDAVKSDIEAEVGQVLNTFKATYFLKRNFHYTIRVDIGGGNFIDLQMNKSLLTDFDENKKAGDPMNL